MSQLLPILQRLHSLKSDLSYITAKSEKAFSVFSPLTSLREMEKIFEESWSHLYRYHNSPNTHFGYLQLQDYTTVRDLFYQVTDATITREEFFDSLSKTREFVEQYIAELQKEIDNQDLALQKLYEEFANDCGELSFIFQEPIVRDLILGKLLQA